MIKLTTDKFDLIASLYFFVFSATIIFLGISKTNALHITLYDLGIFQNHLFNLRENGIWQIPLHGHVQPLLYLYSIGYSFFPTAYFLIVLQALLISSSFFLTTKIAQKHSISPVLANTLFLLHFGLWYGSLNGFHVDHALVPLSLLFYLAVDMRKLKLIAVSALAVALVKEPYALVTAFMGIYLALHCQKFREPQNCLLVGLFLVVFGTAYLTLCLFFVLPKYNGASGGVLLSPAYSWLGHTTFEKLTFIASNPLSIISEIFGTFPKQKLLLALFFAFGGVCVLSPIALIPAIPVFGMMFLSQLVNYHSIYNHYTLGLLAPCFFSFIKAYRQIQIYVLSKPRRLQTLRFWVMASAFSIHILLSPSPISRVFLDQKLWDFSHTAYIETERDKRIKNLIERYIPANKETVVTTQNTVLTSNLANRNYLLSFPAGAVSDHQPHFFQPNGNTKFQSEFVIIDLTRPLYLIDKGCGWIYGSCTIESIQSKHSQALRSIQERYTILVEHDDFFIFKKKSNTTR